MSRQPAEDIVNFLSFSDRGERCATFRHLSPRKWKGILQWLNDSGLAFYFLQKLQASDSTGLLPSWVISQLETSYEMNQQRTEDLLQRFDLINTRFTAAGIPFAVLKGFSLVPEFCPSSSLRHQSDFDYLVDEDALPTAREILLALGYTHRNSRSSLESVFLCPGASAPYRNGRQYSVHAPHAVELHLDVWDSQLYRLPELPQLFSPERATGCRLNGLLFPALNEEDAFLLQVVHTCHHLFTHWIRMSSLFEIAYFMSRRAPDSPLWSRVQDRVSSNPVLREFVVIVAGLAAELFGCPAPCLIQTWSEHLRPGVRLWLNRYSRTWAFSDLPVVQFDLFPASKLVLFLHQQYWHNVRKEPSTPLGTSTSTSRPARILSAIKRDPALLLNAAWWRQQRLVRRTLFHGLAGLRYICEIPRWRWLMQSRAAPPPATSITQIAECGRPEGQ